MIYLPLTPHRRTANNQQKTSLPLLPSVLASFAGHITGSEMSRHNPTGVDRTMSCMKNACATHVSGLLASSPNLIHDLTCSPITGYKHLLKIPHLISPSIRGIALYADRKSSVKERKSVGDLGAPDGDSLTVVSTPFTMAAPGA